MTKMVTEDTIHVHCRRKPLNIQLVSLPGFARLSLVVQNLHRRPGLVHHVMCATVYVTTILLRINDVIGWAIMTF